MRQLDEAHDLEGGAVDDVGVGEARRSAAGCSASNWLRARARPVPAIGPPRLAVGGLLDAVEVEVADVLATLVGPFLAAEVGVAPCGPPAAARGSPAPRSARARLVTSRSASSNACALALDEGVEVVGRDELVLGPVDEPDELVEPVVRVAAAGVVEERQVRPDVAEQQDLADPVEHVGVRRQPRLRGVVGQDPVAEAVEVADRRGGLGRRRRWPPRARSPSSFAARTL